MKSELKTFANWWWCGLTPRLSGSKSERFLTVDDDAIGLIPEFGAKAVALSDHKQLNEIIEQGAVYLLAPSDKVLKLAIPKSAEGAQGKEHVDQGKLPKTLASSLPFEEDELYFTIDQQNNEIFAIPRIDVEPAIQKLAAHQHKPSGIAFSSPSGFHTVDLGSRQPSVFSGNKKKPVKLSGIFALLGTLVLVAGLASLFAWNAQTQKQAELQSQIDRLSSQTVNTYKSGQIELSGLEKNIATLQQPYPIDASRILSSIAQTLPIDARVNQLILNEQELVIDGEAVSATSVQTLLEPLPIFGNSEFISAISRSGESQMERFRLKLTLGDKASD